MSRIGDVAALPGAAPEVAALRSAINWRFKASKWCIHTELTTCTVKQPLWKATA
jgi:hypothetical protein